jgi:hypothetical protein
MKKYVLAKRVHTVFRTSLDALLKEGDLEGFTLSALPSPAAGKVHGFDLWFADRCVRMIFTTSSQPTGVVAIECLRVPVAYGDEIEELQVYEVDKDGGVHLPDNPDFLWTQEPAGVYDLLSHLVEKALSSRV